MNLDPYELDAKARNDNAKRERTAKNKEVQKNQLPHTRLKSNFTTYKNVTASRLECLAKGKFDQPVVSLYLNLSPERLLRQKDVYLTVFNSLKHTALQDNKAYMESLTHDQRQSVDDDLILIHKFLQEDFDTTETRSLAIFKSGNQLQWKFQLGLPNDDYLSIDPDPYTLPLIVQLDEQRSALVLHLEVDRADFYKYQSGKVRLLQSMKSQVPDLSIDLSRPNKVQRHNYDHLNRHFKSACNKMGTLSRRHDLTEVVLMGDNRVVDIFKKDCLTSDKQQQVIAALPYVPGSTDGEIGDQVYQALQQNEVAEEGYYLDMIQKEGSREGIVRGLEEVISAQNRHMIRSLLVDKELRQPGYYCDHDSYISVDGSECPLCGREMLAIDNVVEKLIELASQFQVDYKIIRQRTDDLERYGGIAGTMYDLQ